MSANFDQVKSTFERYSATWKANDGPGVAAFFAHDGTLVNPFGQRAEGRESIAAMYTEYFGGMLRGTTTSIDLSAVRTVEGNHAFADATQTVHSTDGGVIMTLHLAALLRQEDGSWLIADARPYAYAAPPA